MHEAASDSKAAPRSGLVGEREILITRDFDAPRELVWAAFTDPKHVDRWWGPRGFALTTHAIDVRVGGQWRFVMRGPDGKEYPNRIAYRELRAPERIAYDHGSDVDDDPARFAVTITLEELGRGRTRVSMRTLFSTAAQRDGVVAFGAVELGESTLAKGAAHVASSLFVETDPARPTVATLRRLLHAPRALVWEAMTRPEHVAHWYGPRGTTVGECRIDLRVGGTYRFVVRSPRGEHGFGGTYREIVPGERIVQTWSWDGAPDASSIESMRLVDLGDKTLVVASVEHASAEALAMHLKHGMEAGANETYGRLDALLPEIAGAPTSLVIERTFAAPRALVFDAWTRPEHFSKWFGPRGASMPTCELDPRPGGAIRFTHRFEGGPSHRIEGRFDRVEPTTHLVFTLHFVGSVPVPGWPPDASIETRVTLRDAEAGTHQRVEQVLFPEAFRDTPAARSECAMATEGWRETLDQLTEHLAARVAKP